MKPEIHFSACPHDCPSTCALVVEKLDDNTIGRVSGNPDNPYTAGVICAKVARYAERTHHPERLTVPLKRTGPKGSGQFTEISWDEALDTVADAFKKATEKHGPETVWPYSYGGTMGLVQEGGLERLRHEMGYSIMRSTTCGGLVNTGWLAGFGRKIGPDPREMAEADLIIIWGTNAVSTQVNVMTHVARAKKNRNAKVVVVDPYENPTAKTADIHIALRPGTDGALACAMMHIAFRDGYADRDYMEKYTDVPGELETHLAAKTPEWAAEITGLSVREIENLAEVYFKTERAYIRLGFGLSRCRNGAVNVHAVSSIPVVAGKWKVPGSGIFFDSGGIYHLDFTLIHGLENKRANVRSIDHSRVGPALTGNKADLGDGPPITAMIIQGTNPMAIAPEQNKVRAGFAREDLFLCVHEQFMTETAMMADIVLPATTFVEHDDFYKGGGHTFLHYGPKIIDAVGQSRSNHDVICDLAKRLGAKHRGFSMSANDIIAETFEKSGYPSLDDMRQKHFYDCAESFENHHFLNGFNFPDGKFRFKPGWENIGPRGSELPALPDHYVAPGGVDDDHPFRLVTPPARNFLNTSFNNTPSSLKREIRPTLQIHGSDAKKYGINDGDPVTIGNKLGEVTLFAKIVDGAKPGVLVAEGIWQNAAFNGGKGINQLVSAEVAAPNGGVVYHDNGVWLKGG
ncbi:MAG: molybdopterin oxidoreductase family protein [Kordiimonadaceae bacterium]|nr:molybdopterin oxidoreductase family protein [Kordiimonadaceae bacterium]